jgi:hypothetical protein
MHPPRVVTHSTQRVSELTGLRRQDILLASGAHVRCHGKGPTSPSSKASDYPVQQETAPNTSTIPTPPTRITPRPR